MEKTYHTYRNSQEILCNQYHLLVASFIGDAVTTINDTKCNFSPLNSTIRIDVQSLIYDVLNLHFKNNTLRAEESDIGIRLQDYGFYDLKLVNLNQVRDIDLIENAAVDINEENIEDNIRQILNKKAYPPIVLDVMCHVVDGYHRIFALKKIGCKQVWAYVPDKKTYSNPDEDFDE